jgi:RHS repeat-associated protein
MGESFLLTGTEIARYVSDDFGNPQGVVGSSPNPFRFAGAFLDSETGLYQMRGRYYDPAFGRFLSRDINPGNSYSYCRNNPASMSDPSGWANSWGGWIPVLGLLSRICADS